MPTFSLESPSPRRAFLGSLAGGAVAVAAGSLLPERADAMRAAEGDEPWLKGYAGAKHKAIFDAPAVNEGFPFVFAANFLDTMVKTYALKPADASAVVVLRHFGIPAAFNDTIWAKYNFGEMFKVTDPATKKPSLRNIFNHSKAGDMLMIDASADKMVARGVKICVCNLALNLLAGKAADAMKMKADVAAKEWTAGILPGVFIVPSGVLAVARAQEAGGTYCFAG